MAAAPSSMVTRCGMCCPAVAQAEQTAAADSAVDGIALRMYDGMPMSIKAEGW